MDGSFDSTKTPLIISSVATKRLQLIMGDRGQELSDRIQSLSFAGSALYKASDGDKGDVSYTSIECSAALLDGPVDPCKTSAVLGVEVSSTAAACRNILHDCIAYQDLLDRLGVQSGDLVEVSNPENPSISPRIARVWAAGDDVLVQGDVDISPFLAYNLGVPYHLAPFFKLKDSLNNNKFKVSITRVVTRPSALQDGVDMRHVVNPSCGSLELPMATHLGLSVIREPDANGDFLPEMEGEEGGEHGQMNGGFQDPEEEVSAMCIKNYFGRDVQIVSLGDVIAIPIPRSDTKKPGLVVSSINMPIDDLENGDFSAPPGVLYFKVTSMKPELPLIQAVDSNHTAIDLEGVTSSGYPVGSRAYLSRDPAKNAAILGVSSSASWLRMDQVCMEHVGKILPVWKKVAHVIACTFHPSSTNIRMKPSILLSGPHGAGKRVAARAAAAALGCHYISISCEDIRPEGMPDEKVVEALDAVLSIAGNYKPVILLLRDVQLLAQPGAPNSESQGARVGAALSQCIVKGLNDPNNKDQSSNQDVFPGRVFIVGTVPDVDDLDSGLRRCFTHEISVDAPEVGERRLLLESFFSTIDQEIQKEAMDNMVQHTAGFLPLELKNVAAEACASAVLDLHSELSKITAEKNQETQVEESVKPPVFKTSHIDQSIVAVRQKTATDIGAPKIPDVQWDDVGGLEDVKLGILDTVELPLKHPELFAGGIRRRSGVLLYGPPGTGKTLLAKAVATECSVNFLSVKGPELINMYVGESERLVRDVFIRARRAKPCVIFFDELDSLAPARGRGSDSGGIMDRVVSQLLAEIDSAQAGSGNDDVFIIGATNRPDLLDPALLRPGRLDKLLYVGIASQSEDREKVLRALTRKFSLQNDVDFSNIAKQCPPLLTGADMYGLCSRAWMTAFKRKVKQDPSDNSNTGVQVQHSDFIECLGTLTPSLTQEDVSRYESIKNEYK